MVLRRIFRGVEQRHRVRTFDSADELPHGLRRTQLVGVPAAELLPAVPGVGVIPAAQSGRRRKVPGPDVAMQGVSAYAPRPEPVDQHAAAVVRRRRFVNPFDPYPCHGIIPKEVKSSI